MDTLKEHAIKRGIDLAVLVVGGIFLTLLLMKVLGGSLLDLITAMP